MPRIRGWLASTFVQPWGVAAFACCLACPVASASEAARSLDDTPAAWTFRVRLDGRDIGQHRFTATPSPDHTGHTLLSEAEFTVRWLGVVVYHYRHRSLEQWRGNCLVALAAETDDDGHAMRVAAALHDDVLQVSTPAPLEIPGCVMSFAYWSAELRSQTRLLNAQTGHLDAVRVNRIDDVSKEAPARPAGARGWRIDGVTRPIYLWYTPQGQWLGLDTRLEGGRLLSYRLMERSEQ